MIWRLIVVDATKPDGQNYASPPHGLVDCAVFNCQSSPPSYSEQEKFKADKKQAAVFCHQYRIPANLPAPLKYKLEKICDNNDNTPILLCLSRSTPVIDHQGVRAGQTMPQGQRGGDRAPGPVQQGGFQELGDGDLPVAHDNMYGEGDITEGAYNDLMQSAGGFTEQPRPRPAPATGYAPIP